MPPPRAELQAALPPESAAIPRPPLGSSPRQPPRGRSKAAATGVACSAAGATRSCGTDQGTSCKPSTPLVAAATRVDRDIYLSMRVAAARVAATRAAARAEGARGPGRRGLSSGSGNTVASPRASVKRLPLPPMRCAAAPPATFRPPVSAAARRGESSLALPPQQRPPQQQPRPTTATEPHQMTATAPERWQQSQPPRPTTAAERWQPRQPRPTTASWLGRWNILGQVWCDRPIAERNAPANGSGNEYSAVSFP